MLAAFVVGAWCATGYAQERPLTRSPHTEHSALLVGLKGIFVDEFAEGEHEQGGGLAAFIELTLLEHLLELELGVVGVLPQESAAQVAFEPLLKVTFHVVEAVDPYVGGGPVVLWGAERPNLRGGGQIVIGSYFWINHAFGLDTDVGGALLSGARDVATEYTFTLGPVLRL